MVMGCRSGLLNVDGVLWQWNDRHSTGSTHSGTFLHTIGNSAFKFVYGFTGSGGDGMGRMPA